MKKIKLSRKYVVWVIAAIQLIAAIVLGIQLVSMNLLPTMYMVIYAVAMLLVFGLTLLATKKRWSTVIMCILSVLISAVMIFGSVALNQVNNTVQEVTTPIEEEKTEMVIVVLADSEVEEITDLSQFMIAYMTEDKEENATAVMKEIENAVGEGVSYLEFKIATDMVDALYAKTMNAMIINEAYIDVIAEVEGYEDFADRIKIIYSKDVIEYISLVDEKESNLDQFVVYISGIDKFGHVSVKSRSDVNILAVVNTKTKQIQLVNTPRDYYVTLPNSGTVKDKLTHAGIYGVENSIGALEDLYDIEIDYYVRMNFSGFEAIIDALGGIDVYSEYDFTVEPIKHYVKGMNHLTGLEALAFARERHAFASGDRQRGENQMAVITATLDKMMSPELLYNYTDILQAVEGMFVTNFSSEDIYTLVKQQLADMQEWSVETYSVTGTGSSQTTYSMPNTYTYVMIPDESTIEEAKEKINAVLEAQ